MKYATPSTGNGPLDGIFTGPQAFATQLVPDECDLGWVKSGGTWAKGAALLAAEAAAVDLAAKRQTLIDAVATMRSWSDDADGAVANWDAWTQTQKNAAMKTTLQRLAVFFDRFADSIEAK